ncbi:GapA-binding peptide SR1P [Pontibacillus salicampi]|uniref:GapA-binding peptide SR1P n=1 Tax=Pontibacillus salicampi TaxID=1449801 RepID=A0ABV6LNI3_9BACI
MGTIVCQDCQKVIEHFENEKVSTLYGTCPSCPSQDEE